MSSLLGTGMNHELTKLCKKFKLVGANVVLFDDEKILYSYNYGYANKEQKLKSNNDSLYMIGSNTKVITALAILKLMEEGLLSLDDDIKKFIPEFEVKSLFDYGKITVEHLLMHRSGLQGDLYNILLGKNRDYHEVIDELKQTYLTSEPGVMFSYSNVGYALLGIIIERVSGLSYPEYIKTQIAKPLGIDIHFLKNEKEREPFSPPISMCYNKKGEAIEDSVSTILSAGSNTYISMNDFVKFGQMFLKKENSVLKKETLALMETLHVKEQIDSELCMIGYGLAHNYFDYGKAVGKVLGHDGGTACHYSLMNYIPSQNVGVAVLTNSERARGVFTALGAKVMTEYLKTKGLITGNLPLEHKYDMVNCEQYPGKFATQLGLVDISKNKRNELVTKVSNFSVKLRPCEDGFLQCFPNSLLLNLPPMKKMIKGFRIKLVKYSGEDVLIFELTNESHKQTMIFGCRYEETTIPESFKKACGNYEVVTENLNVKDCKCSLYMKNNVLICELEALNTKITNCLKVTDEHLAFTQGFGRAARQAVILREEKGEFYLTYSGIVFKKQ